MGELRMSATERDRLDVFGRVKRGEMTVVAAAELLALSVRQARRAWKRFKASGAAGLAHGLRGRASNRALSAGDAARAVKLHQELYADFGPTLACEKLAADHDVTISPDTLTALLKARGLWVRRRKRGRHRRRRERRASPGSLVQVDGSHHDWFEGRGVKCVLMVMIDDATGWTLARFYGAETTAAAFDVFGRWAAAKGGVPRAVYADRHGIYRDEGHPAKPTQFGRAMKGLAVELILARSPQAKGRVERRHAVFQDRLVKELRLRRIDTVAGANALLDASFLADLNRRFAVKPASGVDLHRPVAAGVCLADVLCVVEERVVGNDWCVRWHNRWLQVDAAHAGLRLPRRRVTVRERADGSVVLEHGGERLTFADLSSRPEPAVGPRPPVANNRRWVPPPSHPWRGGLGRKTSAAVPPPPAGAGQRRKTKAG